MLAFNKARYLITCYIITPIEEPQPFVTPVKRGYNYYPYPII